MCQKIRAAIAAGARRWSVAHETLTLESDLKFKCPIVSLNLVFTCIQTTVPNTRHRAIAIAMPPSGKPSLVRSTFSIHGKGLGKSIPGKRHRKVLKDNIQGITKPAIRRLARRGGVKRISADIYDQMRAVVKTRLEVVSLDRHVKAGSDRNAYRSAEPKDCHCARRGLRIEETRSDHLRAGRWIWLHKRILSSWARNSVRRAWKSKRQVCFWMINHIMSGSAYMGGRICPRRETESEQMLY
nr:histone h4 [Quercus suber]